MKKNLIWLMLFLHIFSAHAEDQFDKLYLLTEDVREVVLKAPGGHPMSDRQFHLTPTQADQMKALSSMDDSTRSYIETKGSKDCDRESDKKGLLEKRVENRNFQIDTLVITSDAKFEQNSLGSFMGNDYMKFMGSLYNSGNRKALDVYSLGTLTTKYKQLNPGNTFDQLSFAEKENVLNSFANSYLATKLPSGLIMKELAFDNMVNHSNQWQETLSVAKNVLSTEQKLELVSKIGGFFGNHYNFQRSEAGESARGVFVTTEQLLDSVKNGSPGGICRDIALAQTQMLQELGFKNSYVVSYKTLEGAHSTALTTDPITGKIIKFNYSETNESKKGSSTQALIQDTSLPDHGIGFRVYDTKGKPVTHVPSEMGQMLRQTAGYGYTRDFNPKNYNLVKVGFGTEQLSGSLFTGKTSSGDNLYGIALYKDQRINQYLKTGLGLSVSKLEGNRSLMHIDQDNLYLRTSLEVNSPSLKTPQSDTKLFAGGAVETLISNNREIYNGSNYTREAKKEIDGSADAYVGIQNNLSSLDGKTRVESKLYANFYPDWNHVASGDRTIAAFDGVTLQSGVSHQISEDKRALIDTAILMKNYGSSMVSRVALEDVGNGTRYLAGVAVPLSKDMPTFLPGGEKRLMFGAEKVTKNMVFSIEYERNLDNHSNSFMLKGKVNF